MPETRVSPRERLVLTAIIELYIATGEPVASQAVADHFAHKEGLSSATIRNVMVSLGERDCWSSRTPRQDVCRPQRRFAITWSRLRGRMRRWGASGVAGAALRTLPQSWNPAERGAPRTD